MHLTGSLSFKSMDLLVLLDVVELAHGAGKATGDYCGQMKCDAFKNG
jgi:hypothetical protein